VEFLVECSFSSRFDGSPVSAFLARVGFAAAAKAGIDGVKFLLLTTTPGNQLISFID
jgi:hypothetical protein